MEKYEEAVNCFGGNAPADAGQEDNSWVLKLKRNLQTGKIQNTVQNVRVILENDPKLCGKIYFDAMSERAMAGASLPWEPEIRPYTARQWRDDDDAGLRCYMELIYGITGKEKILDGLAVYLRNHQVHGLKERLLQTQWDGVPRVDTLLQDYFGAVDSLYTREAMRKTLVGAVARILNPGVKFDTMLILSGRQGLGKSTFFRFLGMEWYSDSLGTFEGKDAAELLQGYWIIEAGELTGMTKSEMNAVKQFLSKCDDIYRASYGRRTEKHPRQCIIVGTTNNQEFLTDVTGNRRFWPVDLTGEGRKKSIWGDLPGEVEQIGSCLIRRA